MTQGNLIDQIFELRERIRELDRQSQSLKDEKTTLEDQLLKDLDAQGVQSVSGRRATASISENIVPSIEDWDSFHAFIRKNNAFYLLQRRANPAPYRELIQQRRGRKIPGVTSVTLRTFEPEGQMMFDDNVEELSLSESNCSFTVKCANLAAYIGHTLAFNGISFHVDTKHNETVSEWLFKTPHYAIGILRTL